MIPEFRQMEGRWQVVNAIKDGLSYRQIQKKYQVSSSYIRKWKKRYAETGDVQDAQRSGRPRKLTVAQERQVVRHLTRNPKTSIRKTTRHVNQLTGVSVSDKTIRKIAARNGLKYRLRRCKPLLTELHKTARLRFANCRRERGYWSRVIWTDEASFALYSNTRGEWVRDGEEATPRQTTKWPTRIRVWAGISSKGKTPLIRIPKSLNAAEFEKLLQDDLLPLMRNIYANEEESFVLMQDGDGTHTAKRVKKMLEEEGIEQLLPWPAHSPDLNPIENAWAMIERHLQTVNPTTERGLWKAMQDGWAKVGEGALLQLTGSLPRRLQAVKDAQGGHTKY